MRAPDYATLDAALDEIAPSGIELKNGNSNHAPMVAEALCALGRPEAVLPWLARYRERLLPRPPQHEAIDRDDWRDALGQRDRFSDWAGFFADELAEAPWPEVLDRWAERLAPGFCAAAAHGPIRVGHAVRGLADEETASRRRELADALAGWAATWQRLPGGGDGGSGRLRPAQAILRVPLVPPERRRGGNIVAGLAALAEFPEFAPVIDLIDASGPPAALLAEATELFARVCLANVRNVPTAIAFIHAVTSHAALGHMLPFLGPAAAQGALRHAWQTGCALYACYGGGAALGELPAPAIDADGLVALALDGGDEHAIKFTEACLCRHAVAPSPAYLPAADHVTRIIARL